MIQGLRFCASTARSAGSVPGPGTKIPHAVQHGQKESNCTPVKNVYKKKRMQLSGKILLGIISWSVLRNTVKHRKHNFINPSNHFTFKE